MMACEERRIATPRCHLGQQRVRPTDRASASPHLESACRRAGLDAEASSLVLEAGPGIDDCREALRVSGRIVFEPKGGGDERRDAPPVQATPVKDEPGKGSPGQVAVATSPQTGEYVGSARTTVERSTAVRPRSERRSGILESRCETGSAPSVRWDRAARDAGPEERQYTYADMRWMRERTAASAMRRVGVEGVRGVREDEGQNGNGRRPTGELATFELAQQHSADPTHRALRRDVRQGCPLFQPNTREAATMETLASSASRSPGPPFATASVDGAAGSPQDRSQTGLRALVSSIGPPVDPRFATCQGCERDARVPAVSSDPARRRRVRPWPEASRA